MAKDYVINPRILSHLKQQCAGDEQMWTLLKDLLYEVVNQEGKAWKDLFKKKIVDASLKAGERLED